MSVFVINIAEGLYNYHMAKICLFERLHPIDKYVDTQTKYCRQTHKNILTHRIREPSIRNERPLLFHTHHFPHILKAGIVWHLIVKRRFVLLNNAWTVEFE